MDKQTTRSDAANQCHTGPVDAAAYGQYPMAQYKAGGTYTLVWPAKNHASAQCTGANIPDSGLKVFASAANFSADPNFSTFQANQIKASFSDVPHENGKIDMEGFQKCEDFCSNTDKAFCHGTIEIPANMAAGRYTFQWYWEFNPGQIYITCFDVNVEAAGAEVTTAIPTIGGLTPGQTPTPTVEGKTP